ncbi:hypothetical protein KKA47_01290, partial [bacterium]|nr:hypothetical protein [bacterium]
PLYMLNFNILQTNYAEQLQGVLQNLNTFEQLSTEQIRDIKEVDEDRILDPSGPVEVDQNLLRYDPSVTINPGEVSKNRVLTTGLKTVVDKNRILTTEIDQDKLRITSDSLRQLSTLREFGNRLYVGDRMVITGYDKFKKAGGNCYGKDGPEETTTETEPETAAQTVTQTASPMVEVVVEESECDHITLKITGAFEEAVWAINDEYEAAGSEVEQVFSDLVPGGEYEIEVTIDSKFKANIMVVIEDSENCNAIVFNDEDGIGETVFQIGDPEKDASENTKTTATAPTHSLFAKGGGCSLVEDSPLTKGSLLFFAILLISPFVIIPARARSKRK